MANKLYSFILKIIVVANCIVLSCLLVPTHCYADIITLNNGTSLELAILQENDKELTVSTRWESTHTIPIDQIKTRTAGSFILDDYDDKLDAITVESAELYYQLGLWCDQNKLIIQAYESYQKAVTLDVNHTLAHKALGYRKNVSGGWDQKTKFWKKQTPYQDAKDHLERGFIQLNSKWRHSSELDVMLSGGILHRDHWLTTEQKTVVDRIEHVKKITVDTTLKLKMPKVTMRRYRTSLFHVESCWTDEQVKHLIAELNTAYFKFLELMELPPHTMLWYRPAEVIIFDGHSDALKYYEIFLQKDNSAAMTELMQENPRTYWYNTAGLLMYKYSGATQESMTSEVLHIVSHQFLFYFNKQVEVPHWLNEGFASWMEYQRAGKSAGFCYGPDSRLSSDDKSALIHFKGENWLSWIKTLVSKKQDRPLSQLVNSELSDLTLEDLAKLYAVNLFLIDISPTQFRQMVIKTKDPDSKVDSLETSYGLPPKELDKQFKKWLRKQK